MTYTLEYRTGAGRRQNYSGHYARVGGSDSPVLGLFRTRRACARDLTPAAIYTICVPVAAFHPLPLIRRPRPFSHPDWLFEADLSRRGNLQIQSNRKLPDTFSPPALGARQAAVASAI